MGLMILALLISLGISWFVYKINSKKSMDEQDKVDRSAFTKAGFVVTALICSLIFCIVVGNSYSSYLENRAFYDNTIEQYRGAVTMYKDYAVIDMEKTRAAFTDFKYQGYQEAMARMIIKLQERIIGYNRSFVLKKVKNNSWFFNWLIIANDPDMKVIRMMEEGK